MFEYVYFALLGLIVGSFLNVIIHRLPIIIMNKPKGYSLAFPSSNCPYCHARISPINNIPVISYILLRGKCANCKKEISISYPVVESISMLLALFAYSRYGISWKTADIILVGWILIVITFIDLKHFLILDILNYILLWTGLLASVFKLGFIESPNAIMGAFVGYISLWSLYWLVRLACKKEGMGYGDFKLNAAMGAWLGPKLLIVHIFTAFLIGAIVGILLLSLKQHERGAMIPFGPFLALAGFISLVWGQELIDYYLRNILM